MSWLRTGHVLCRQLNRKSPLSMAKRLQKDLPNTTLISKLQQTDFHVFSIGENMTNSRLFATKAEPEISSNSIQTRRNQDDKSETVMHSINLLVQKSGRVLPNDVKSEYKLQKQKEFKHLSR